LLTKNELKRQIKLRAKIIELKARKRLVNKIHDYFVDNSFWIIHRTKIGSAQLAAKISRAERTLNPPPLPYDWLPPLKENEKEVLGPYYEYDESGEPTGAVHEFSRN
jgi:hypothetical protein